MSPAKSVICIFLFVLCCSSRCFKEDKTPGPQTTIHGVVKDYRTGQTFPGIKIIIVKQYNTLAHFDNGPSYDSYDGPTTGSDGSFNYTFTPQGSGQYTLGIYQTPNSKFPFIIAQTGDASPLTLGKNNEINFSVLTALNLNIHVTNNSGHQKQQFSLSVDTNSFYYFNYLSYFTPRNIAPYPLDTVYTGVQVPQMANIIVFSRYHSNTTNGSYDTLSFQKAFQLHKADTTITIVNPWAVINWDLDDSRRSSMMNLYT